MRDIKFRVWDQINKVFYHLDYLSVGLTSGNRRTDGKKLGFFTLKMHNQICPEVDEIHVGEPAFIIQQCTCVPDKNMKQIYEGDLISYRGRIGVVEFFAGMFVCSWNWGENDDQTETELGYMITADMEIVGHIYDEKEETETKSQNPID